MVTYPIYFHTYTPTSTTRNNPEPTFKMLLRLSAMKLHYTNKMPRGNKNKS